MAETNGMDNAPDEDHSEMMKEVESVQVAACSRKKKLKRLAEKEQEEYENLPPNESGISLVSEEVEPKSLDKQGVSIDSENKEIRLTTQRRKEIMEELLAQKMREKKKQCISQEEALPNSLPKTEPVPNSLHQEEEGLSEDDPSPKQYMKIPDAEDDICNKLRKFYPSNVRGRNKLFGVIEEGFSLLGECQPEEEDLRNEQLDLEVGKRKKKSLDSLLAKVIKPTVSSIQSEAPPVQEESKKEEPQLMSEEKFKLEIGCKETLNPAALQAEPHFEEEVELVIEKEAVIPSIGRAELINQLKTASMQRRSMHVTKEDIQALTYKTELTTKEEKNKNSEQAQESDSSYNPEAPEEELNNEEYGVIDSESEEENIEEVEKEDKSIEEHNIIDIPLSDQEDKPEIQESQLSSLHSTNQVMQSQEEGILTNMISERKKLFRESEIEEEEKKKIEENKQQVKIRDSQLRKFYDTEAELGSDHEQNDDIRKEIDKNDREENEEGLDKELDEILDKKYQVTGEDQEQLMQKFMKEEEKEDKSMLQRAIMGDFARKRGRDEAALEDLGADYAEKRFKRMQERERMLEEREKEAYEILAHGTNNAQLKLREKLEGDNCSEEEMEMALEHNKEIEMRRALRGIGRTGPLLDFEFQAMIEKKNVSARTTGKPTQNMTQAEAVRQATKSNSLMKLFNTAPKAGVVTGSLLASVVPNSSEKSPNMNVFSLNQFVKYKPRK